MYFVQLWELMMVNNVKISVLISINENIEYARKCLDTLRFQTYENLEFICNNVNSSTEMKSLLHDYETIDNRFKIIDSSDKKSIFELLQYATGEYISFINSNHWVLLNLYQTFINTLKSLNQNIDIYIFNIASYKEDQNDILPPTSFTLSDWNNHFSNLSIHTCKDCKRPFSTNLLLENKIYYKDFMLKIGESYNKFLEYKNRYAYLVYFLNAKSIVLNNDVFYRYRIIDNGTGSEFTFDIFEIIDKIVDEVRKNGLYENYKYALFQFKYNTYFQYYILCPDNIKQEYFTHMKNKLDIKNFSDLDFNICQRLTGFDLYLFIVQNDYTTFNTILNKRF